MTNKPKLQRRKVINVPVRAVFMGVSSACLWNLKQFRDRKAVAARSYRGGFPSSVIEIIKELVSGRVLNLYSGASDIGNVRVDLACPEATHKMTVEEYIAGDKSHWDWVILDPPYKIKRPEHLSNFADARPLTGNALIKDRLRLYLRAAADNVLWLDYCSPTVKGFQRKYIWLLIPGNCWESCRILTWLSRTGAEMIIRPGGYVAPDPEPGPGPAGAPRGGLLRAGVYNRDYERTPEAVAVIGAEQGWRGLITPAFPRDKGEILTM